MKDSIKRAIPIFEFIVIVILTVGLIVNAIYSKQENDNHLIEPMVEHLEVDGVPKELQEICYGIALQAINDFGTNRISISYSYTNAFGTDSIQAVVTYGETSCVYSCFIFMEE